MCITPSTAQIESCPSNSRRKEATRRATARAAHPAQARYSSRPRRATCSSSVDRWESEPRSHCRPPSRLRHVSAARIIQGLMATGGWDPAFIVARRRYLMQHPEG
jgi:hypothetical protein